MITTMCNNCGRVIEIEEGTLRCPFCQAKLVNEDDIADEKAEKPIKLRSLAFKRKIALILCGIIVLIIVGGHCYLMFPRRPFDGAFGYKFGTKFLDVEFDTIYGRETKVPLLTDGLDGFANHCFLETAWHNGEICKISINSKSNIKDEYDLSKLFDKTCKMIEDRYPKWEKKDININTGMYSLSRKTYSPKNSKFAITVEHWRDEKDRYLSEPGCITLSFIDEKLANKSYRAYCKEEKKRKKDKDLQSPNSDEAKELDKIIGK